MAWTLSQINSHTLAIYFVVLVLHFRFSISMEIPCFFLTIDLDFPSCDLNQPTALLLTASFSQFHLKQLLLDHLEFLGSVSVTGTVFDFTVFRNESVVTPRLSSKCTQKRITNATTSVLWVQHLPRRRLGRRPTCLMKTHLTKKTSTD